VKELRERKEFTPKSQKKISDKSRAAYIQKNIEVKINHGI
jgi:hypothetical protein